MGTAWLSSREAEAAGLDAAKRRSQAGRPHPGGPPPVRRRPHVLTRGAAAIRSWYPISSIRKDYKMNGFHSYRSGTALAVLVGTTLLAACPVRAQISTIHKIKTEVAAQASRHDDAKGGKTPQDKNGNPVQPGVGTTLVDRPLLFRASVDGASSEYATGLGEALIARFHDQADETLGATLQPVSAALRAQLDVPVGQGLLVASLRADSPTAQAGLKQNDILLFLADKPLATADDLTKQLKAAGETAVPLKVLRAGKPITIQVRPIYRVTLGPVEERKTEYYLGVSIDPVDDALRAQLELPAGHGVVVNDVSGGSPAEKSGVKKHDIVLELAGKPIDSPETLAAHVQS